MYNFIEENHEYRYICTDDKKHVLFIQGPEDSGKTCEDFAKAHNLVVNNGVKPGEETKLLWVAYTNPNPERFLVAIGALIRRLAPFKPFDFMYKYFYRTKKNYLIVQALYMGAEGEECPFTPYDEKRHGKLMNMELPHA